MTKREKGVATVPCPRCGTGLNMETRSDGGMSPSRCNHCYPAAASEKASAPIVRELGTEPEVVVESTVEEA